MEVPHTERVITAMVREGAAMVPVPAPHATTVPWVLDRVGGETYIPCLTFAATAACPWTIDATQAARPKVAPAGREAAPAEERRTKNGSIGSICSIGFIG